MQSLLCNEIRQYIMDNYAGPMIGETIQVIAGIQIQVARKSSVNINGIISNTHTVKCIILSSKHSKLCRTRRGKFFVDISCFAFYNPINNRRHYHACIILPQSYVNRIFVDLMDKMKKTVESFEFSHSCGDDDAENAVKSGHVMIRYAREADELKQTERAKKIYFDVRTF